MYNVGSTDENYCISEIAAIVNEEVGAVDITYLEDEHPGPPYHIDFDRLAGTGFQPQWTLREGVRVIAGRFTDGPQ